MARTSVKNFCTLYTARNIARLGFPTTSANRLYAYQAGIFTQCESPALVIGGVEDHTHALVLPVEKKNRCPQEIVEEVKKASSKWMKTEGSENKDFHWQNGYAAFSVSA